MDTEQLKKYAIATMMRPGKLVLFSVAVGLAGTLALDARAFALPISPSEIFSRTQSVMDHFQVPTEGDPSSELSSLQQLQTNQEMQKILPVLDPRNFFDRFFSYDSETSTLTAFQDIDAKNVPDFSISLAKTQGRISPLELRLRTAATSNSANLPLCGLRIALDPGHMGGHFWDNETGKFVRASDGTIISEGVLNLQTVLLLENELQLLGATTLVTHRSLEPVSTMPMTSLPLHDFGLESLRESSLDSWFQQLLGASTGTNLFEAFNNSPHFQGLFKESRRSTYFISLEDLQARTDMIQAFAPDLTLVIHYDTVDPPGNGTGINPRGYDHTKTYVNGTYALEELSSREDRKFFVNHLLDPFAWETSRGLSKAIVHQLHDQLSLPYDTVGGGDSVALEPGLFARNLCLNRQLSGHALSYIEVLHYNDPQEFAWLSSGSHPLSIDGVNYPYSDRLVSVVQAIKGGVLEFMASDYLHPH